MKKDFNHFFAPVLFFNGVFISCILSYSSAFAAESITPPTVVTCTADHCPLSVASLSRENLNEQVVIYQTSNKPEFMQQSTQTFTNKDNGGWQSIVINESELKNPTPIVGFGGAFTDAASMLYKNMSHRLQQALINAFFSAQGIEYSLGRVPMASHDFSCREEVSVNGKTITRPSLTSCSATASQYSYADVYDNTLSNFTLQPEDTDYKIPMIQAAIAAVNSNHNTLKLFASPWSAPAWMKTNGSMVHGGLKPEFRQLWANYFIKFLQAYKQHHILFWGLTVQNEPVDFGYLGTTLFQNWQTMFSTEIEEGDFVKNYLGPTLKQFEQSYGTKIHLMIHDDQVTTIEQRVTMLNDPEVSAYVDGAGLHWYMNNDQRFGNLDAAYQALNKPESDRKRFIIGTEACEGYFPLNRGPLLGNWPRGESYAHDIISDLNHYVSGWTDWNLVLDMQGGPNWAKNYVDAPMLFDLKSQTLYVQPMYYYLGHFSKFIRPGSVLLASQSRGPFPLEEVVFKVPAHGNLPEIITIVVLNRDITGRNYYIQDNSRPGKNKYLNMYIPAHAIQTIIFKSKSSSL